MVASVMVARRERVPLGLAKPSRPAPVVTIVPYPGSPLSLVRAEASTVSALLENTSMALPPYAGTRLKMRAAPLDHCTTRPPPLVASGRPSTSVTRAISGDVAAVPVSL